MRRSLPLNALRAFEATARLGSFTLAAGELAVTPAAVGQQVRGLEARLGGPLLDRNPDGLSPTVEAERVLPTLQRGFEYLAQGFDSLAETHAGDRVAVSVAPTFAIKWLVPRLPRFYERNAEIELNFDTAMRFVDIARGEADLAIRFGAGRYHGLRCERLFGEWVLPVCASVLGTGKQALRRPEDLAHAPLIHLRGETTDETWPDWGAWCAAFGVVEVLTDEGPSFSQSATALQAALAGQGVALCGLTYALDDLEAGRLCAPFGPGSAMPTQYGYDMVYIASRGERGPMRTFRRWIKREAEEARRRIEAFFSA